MNEKVSQLHTLPKLFNSIYNLYIIKNLSHGAASLLFALIYKFNQVIDRITKKFFPDSLSIYNFELANILGINEKTLIKLRHELTTYRLIQNNEETWIVKYESAGTREAGFYQINYHLLENIDNSNLSLYYSLNGEQTGNNDIQESQDIGNKMAAIIPKNSKNCSKLTALPNYTTTKQEGTSLSIPIQGTILSKEVAVVEKEKKDYYDPLGKEEPTPKEIQESESDILDEERFQNIKQLFKANCTGFELGGKPRVVAFRKILKYPDEKIKTVVERAGEYGTDSSHILSWVCKGLENYDRLYKNNDYHDIKSITYKEFEPMSEENYNQLVEGLELKRLRSIEEYKKRQEKGQS